MQKFFRGDQIIVSVHREACHYALRFKQSILCTPYFQKRNNAVIVFLSKCFSWETRGTGYSYTREYSQFRHIELILDFAVDGNHHCLCVSRSCYSDKLLDPLKDNEKIDQKTVLICSNES